MYEALHSWMVGDGRRWLACVGAVVVAASVAGCRAPGDTQGVDWAKYLAHQQTGSDSGVLFLELTSLSLETSVNLAKASYERSFRLSGIVRRPTREPGVRVDPVLVVERIEDQSGHDLSPYLRERRPGQMDPRRRGNMQWPQSSGGTTSVIAEAENLPARELSGLRIVQGYASVDLPAATARVDLDWAGGERAGAVTDAARAEVQETKGSSGQLQLLIKLHETPVRDYRTELLDPPLLFDVQLLDAEGKSVAQARVNRARMGRDGLEYVAYLSYARDHTAEDVSRIRLDWVTEAQEVRLPFELRNVRLERR